MKNGTWINKERFKQQNTIPNVEYFTLYWWVFFYKI